MRGDMQIGRGVIQRLTVDGNEAAVWTQQAGYHVDQRGLAGARGSEQPGYPARALEPRFYVKVSELLGNIDPQHGQFPCRRCSARRANHSDAISAASAMMIETTTSRSAAVSPSGVWINEYTAEEMVWVSPGMLETKVMVAPNSPIALAKPSTMPASTPGSASGSVTLANTRHMPAPPPGQPRRQRAPRNPPPRPRAERGGGLLQPAIHRLDRQPDRPH